MNIKEVLEEQKFKYSENQWCGKFNGFYCNIIENSFENNVIEVTFFSSISEHKGKIVDFLEDCKSKNKIKSYNKDEKSFDIDFSKYVTAEDFIQFIDEYCELLKEVNASNVCSNCKSRFSVNFYDVNHSVSLLCDSCFDTINKTIQNNKEKPNNYFLGFICSLLGSIIGSIVWIGLGAVGFYASIAGLAIAVAAFYGYKIGKGKYTKIGIVINVITILAGVFFAEFIGLYIEIAKELRDPNFFVFFRFFSAIIKDKEVIFSSLPSLCLGLLFAFLGSYRIIIDNYIKAKTEESIEIKKIEL